MVKPLALFCPNCNTVLVARNPPGDYSACPSCGLVAGTEQRILQKISLPFATDTSLGLTGHSDHLWIWGMQNGKVQLVHFIPTDSKIQAIHSTPNNWQVSGLAITKKILIFAPQELNPPSTSKALVGIYPNTGKIAWEYAATGFMFTMPVADEQMACAIDSHGTLVAVNTITGKSTWLTYPQLGDFPHQGIPPVLSNQHVLVVESESLGAGLIAFHRSTGEISWEFRPPENAKVDFVPVIFNDSVFVLASEWLYHVALADGAWTRISRSERKSSQGWYFAPPVVDDEYVYLLEANYKEGKPAYVLQARDAATGQSGWELPLGHRPHQPPAISGGHVYFVDRDGGLFCINKQDGKVVWRETLGAEPADAPVVTQDAVFVLTKDSSLHTIKLSTPTIDISQPPAFYEKRGEWSQAAGAYLATGQPFEAGLSLLKINDHRQASLAFNMVDSVEQKIKRIIQEFTRYKNDTNAGELSENWGMVLLEQLSEQARGNEQVAQWFEQAAKSFMLANQTLNAMNCRERAAQVMETPRIRLEVVVEEGTHWIVNEPLLLHVKVTNVGYGPARRVTIKVQGNIKKPYPIQNFLDIAIDSIQKWENIRVTPNSSGAGLLEFVLDYESYRSGQTTQTKFTHPIQVGKNQDASIVRALQNGAQFHIEKFFSPGAMQNEIKITDSQGIAVGDQTQSQPVPAQSNVELKENQMDPIALIVSALVGGLTTGLTDTVKAATKDIYDALKSRLIKKAEKSEDAQDAIAKVEKQPDSKARQELLKEELGKLPLDNDDELLKLAQSLLDVLKKSDDKSGKYNLDIQNSQGIVVGDNSNVTQNFGDVDRKKNNKLSK